MEDEEQNDIKEDLEIKDSPIVRYLGSLISITVFYAKYLSRYIQSPAKVKVVSIVIYLLTLPISLTLSLTYISLNHLHDAIYEDYIYEVLNQHFQENYSGYKELETIELLEYYNAKSLFDSYTGKIYQIVLHEDKLDLVETRSNFSFYMGSLGFILKNLEIEKIFSLELEDLSLERRNFYGVKCCNIEIGDDIYRIAFPSGEFPEFVEEKINNQLKVVDRQEFEKTLYGDFWDFEEKDNLAKSLDEELWTRGLAGEEYFFFHGRDSKGFILVDGQKLVFLYIDESDMSISKPREIDMKRVKQYDNGDCTAFNRRRNVGRGNNEIIERACFDDIGTADKFRKELKKELNSKGLVSYKRIWDTPENIQEAKEADIGLKNNFQNHTPYEFEEFVRELFEEKGYTAEHTKKSSDYGLDVIAENETEKVGIQVKRYKESSKIGSPTVRDTLGSIHKIDADRSILITTSYFTSNAKEQARNSPIELWDKGRLHREVRNQFL